MALGYGYVKRDEPQQIDWGAIGKEMTDFIKSDQESRTKRKEEIQNQYIFVIQVEIRLKY